MKRTIHYALILDESGSMYHLKDEVISSFNEQVDLIRKLVKKEKETEVKLTLCIFNDTVEFAYELEDVDNLRKLRNKDYQPNSCTALYDAIGTTMLKIKESKQDEDKVFLAIFTDGLENASNDYSAKDISYKLKKAEKENWSVKFYCRYEDERFYEKKLDVPKSNFYAVKMSKKGLGKMNSDIHFCLSSIFDESKEDEL